jgi:hypothetical protein
MILLSKVFLLNMFGSLTPAMIAFIYGIPLPCANGEINWIQLCAIATQRIPTPIQTQ